MTQTTNKPRKKACAWFTTFIMALSIFSVLVPFMPAVTVWAGDGQAPAVNGYYNTLKGYSVGAQLDEWASDGNWAVVSGSNSTANAWGAYGGANMSPEAYYYSWNRFYRWQNGSNIAVYNEFEYTDFDFSTFLFINNNSSKGSIVFRYQDENNYYFLRADASTNQYAFGKVVNGTETILNTRSATVPVNAQNMIRVTAVGDTFEVWRTSELTFTNRYPGTRLFTVTDGEFASGKCGLWAEGGSANAYQAMAISDFSNDRTISNEYFTLTTGAYGQIKELYLNQSTETVNYVVNEETHRLVVGPNQFLGELKFTYQVDGGQKQKGTTGDSVDIRDITLDSSENKITVEYAGDSSRTGGIAGFDVTESYQLVGDTVQFDITLDNTSGKDITFLDIGMPVTWNNHWQHDVYTDLYESYLSATANFISYDASYVQVEIGKGGKEKLLLLPDQATDARLEYRKFYSTQETVWNPPEEYYIFSENIQNDPDDWYFNESQAYLEGTSLTVPAGESKTISFKIAYADDYNDVGEVLYEEDLLDITVNPGMILPNNMTAKIDIHTTQNVVGIEGVQDDGLTSSLLSNNNDHNVYELGFTKLGRNDVKITYGDGKESVLQFWIMDDLEAAMQERVDFLMQYCRITNPTDPHYPGFLEWDNANNVAKVSGNGCNNNDFEQMYDGPAYIIDKNIYYPVQEEITAVDDYLVDLVWEKEVIHNGGVYDYRLHHSCCGIKCWMDASPDLCVRHYNYVRVANTFYSMYQVAAAYPEMEFRWSAEEYLEVAGNIMARGIELATDLGLMGDQTTAGMVADLNAEGLTETADNLYALALRKASTMAREQYPFRSEYGSDSTGEEGAYFYGKIGYEAGQQDTSVMEKTINKILAWKGGVNTWYYQTSSNRQDNDWWQFQYSVGLQGAAVEDWYFSYQNDAEDYWSLVYPNKLAPFVHINSGQPELLNAQTNVGTVWGNYKATKPYNWNHGFPYSESAEADISLWAGLQILGADIVLNDPAFGLTGYGAAVQDTGTAYEMVPQDGLYRRFKLVGDANTRLSVELQNDRYNKALINHGLDGLTLQVENMTGIAHTGFIHTEGMAPGTYQVVVDGRVQGYVVAEGDSTSFAYQINSEYDHEVTIQPSEHVGGFSVAIVGDDIAAGVGTSNYEEKSFPVQLGAMLEGTDYASNVFAEADTKVADFAATQAYTDSLAANPDIVVLQFSASDAKSWTSAEDFIQSYEALVEKYEQESSTKLIYLALPTFAHGDAHGITQSFVENQLLPAVKTVSENKQLLYIDLYTATQNAADKFPDGIYPDNNGANLLARTMYTMLTSQTAPAEISSYDGYGDISAAAYDSQGGGALYQNPNAADVYVNMDEGSHITFKNVELGTGPISLDANVKNAADLTLQVYLGGADGRLVGVGTVAANSSWNTASVELEAIAGTRDITLAVPDGVLDISSFTFTQHPAPGYEHDFEIDDGQWVEYAGNWNLDDGEYIGGGTGKSVLHGYSFEDFVYELDFRVASGSINWSGPIFRVQNPSDGGVELYDGYTFNFNVAENAIWFTRHDQSWNHLETASYELEYDRDYHLRIVAVGDTFQLYVDGELAMTVTDGTYATGTVGLRVYNTITAIDNVKVTHITTNTPVFTREPMDVSVYEGEDVAFSGEASALTGDGITYQWQTSRNKVTWTDIAGETETTFAIENVGVATHNNTYYRLIATNTVDGVEIPYPSRTATLTVTPLPVVESIDITPDDAVVGRGNNKQFTAAVQGQFDPPQGVVWSVNAGSESTVISETGVLTVAADEPNASVTVIATSVFDSSKSGSVPVNVVDLVDPDFETVYIFTKVGVAPNMPSQIAGTMLDENNNTITSTFDVTWEAVAAWRYGTEGSLEVLGTVFETGTTVRAWVFVQDNDEDLALWYRFDEGEGTRILDWSGNGLDAEITRGTPLWTEDGKFGGALDFNTNWVELEDPDGLTQPEKLTFSYWVYRDKAFTQNNVIFWAKPDMGWSGNGWYVCIDGPIHFFADSGNSVRTSSNANDILPLNQWSNVTVTYDAGDVAIYVNGVAQSTTGTTGDTITKTPESTRYIGFNTPGWNASFVEVPLDDMRIYSRTFTETEVQELYATEVPPVDYPVYTEATEDNVTLHLTFDEAAGSNSATDHSVHGNNAVLNGDTNAWTEDGYAISTGSYFQVPGAEVVHPDMTAILNIKRTGTWSGSVSLFWGKNTADWAGNGIWLNSTADTAMYINVDGSDQLTISQNRNTFFPLDEWVEIAVSVSTETGVVAAYRNGELVALNGATNAKKVTTPSASLNNIGYSGHNGEALHNTTLGEYIFLDTFINSVDAKAIYEGKFHLRNYGDEAPDVTREMLQGLVDHAKALTEEDYTAESWEDLQTALENAQDVLDEPTSSDEAIAAAYDNLQAALDALEPAPEPGVDKTGLEAILDEIDALNAGEYTAESRAALAALLEAAEDLLADENATQDAVTEMVNRLRSAIDALEEKTEPGVDKSSLRALYNSYDGTTQGAYTDASWYDFTQAMAAALAVLNDDGASQTEVDNAYNALAAAIDGLEEDLEEPVDKTALQTLYDQHSGKEKGNYTDASWEAFTGALAAAAGVLADDDATQGEVNSAYATLNAAVNGLEENSAGVDKAELQRLVDEANGLAASAYTPESWQQLQQALTAAQGVLVDDTATQPQVDAAATALAQALDGLVAVTPPGGVDKADLAAAIAKAAALDESKYTADSWSSLQTALTNARAVNADGNATQTEVNNALQALENAIAALKTVDGTDPGGPDEPGGEDKSYGFIVGKDGAFKLGEDITFVVDADYSLFLGVRVNGNTLTRDLHYTAREGSTIITLLATYTAGLGEGAYEIEFLFADGTASTSFTLAPASSSSGTGGSGDSAIASTGDGFAPTVWITLASLAVLFAAALVVQKRRAKQK